MSLNLAVTLTESARARPDKAATGKILKTELKAKLEAAKAAGRA